jgi:hypothetical protein
MLPRIEANPIAANQQPVDLAIKELGLGPSRYLSKISIVLAGTLSTQAQD